MTTPCWQEIGVWAATEPTCPELDRVTHCHNCDVFREAGRQLLERLPPDGYGEGWLEQLAALRATPGTLVLVFRVAGDELLALSASVLHEVLEWRAVRRVPHVRDGLLLGLVNLGGDLQLCVALEALLGLPRPDPSARPPRGRLLAIGSGSVEWAVLVQDALTLHEVPEEQLSPPPATVSASAAPYVRGMFTWRDQPVGLLDEELVLATLRRRIA
jgi:chemotaxis-related protein WspD